MKMIYFLNQTFLEFDQGLGGKCSGMARWVGFPKGSENRIGAELSRVVSRLWCHWVGLVFGDESSRGVL